MYGERAFPYALHTIDDFGRQPVAEHHCSRILLRKKLQRYYEDFTGNKAVIEDIADDEASQTAAA